MADTEAFQLSDLAKQLDIIDAGRDVLDVHLVELVDQKGDTVDADYDLIEKAAKALADSARSILEMLGREEATSQDGTKTYKHGSKEHEEAMARTEKGFDRQLPPLHSFDEIMGLTPPNSRMPDVWTTTLVPERPDHDTNDFNSLFGVRR